MPCHLVIPAADLSRVGEARRAAAVLAKGAGFGAGQQGEIAIIATELTTNLAKHATNGRLLLQAIPPSGAQASASMELIAVDTGPGMSDPERCLRDGYSTGGTAGTGLGAVRRLSSEFDVYSTLDQGTVLLSRVNAEACATARNGNRLRWGVVSIPAPHEVACGDAWTVRVDDSRCAILVADGLGHGPLAEAASKQAVEVFNSNPFAEPQAVVQAIHVALSGSRGAAISVAHIDREKRVLRYAGLGNISASLLSDREGSGRGLFSHNGTAGVHVRKVQQFEYPCGENGKSGTLIMHSDGLQSRWSLEKYPGLRQRHPGVIAGILYRDLTRGRDDVTVLVVDGL